MKIIIYCLFILSLISCQKKELKELQEERIVLKQELLKSLPYALHVKNFSVLDEVITRPIGAESLILSIQYYDEGSLKLFNDCLYYRTPFREKKGELTLVRQFKKECQEIQEGKVIASLKEISDLMISRKGHRLTFSYVKENEFISSSYPLVDEKGKIKHEKYQSIKREALYPSLQILKIETDTFDSTNPNLGKINDSFALGSAIQCHRVSKDCKDLKENICDRCRYGYYEVVDYQCPQGGSKYCGVNRCGEKNGPACVRGQQQYEESTQGFCNPELTPVMNADGIWVCQ